MSLSNAEESTCSAETGEFVSQLCNEDHVFAGDDNLFYFETDFLALKGNTDYLKLMKTLAILEAQRVKVFQDINELNELKLKAVDDPEAIKEQILNGKLPCLSRVKIEKVPDIDFSKYRFLSNEGKKHFSTRRKMTRQQNSNREDSEGSSEIKVRGRVYTEKKPRTFNQLWSVEEQLRLEQLLAEIPPQPVEYRRWEKIAEALGSRTAQQVCSRVQKYFKKLEKAGINANTGNRRRSYKKHAYYVHKQHKHFLYKPSTFFPGATMGELEDTDSDQDSDSSSATPDLSHWTEIHKKINEERDNEELKVQHLGFKCHKCRTEPIVGLRWECKNCPSISFCSECMSTLPDMNPPPHPLTHHFKYVDLFDNRSYRTDAFSCDNYLDPNAHLT